MSAPSRRASCNLPSCDDVTITLAPRRFAIRIAANETPPPIPQIRAVSPARSRARVTTMRQAVKVTSENAAASSWGNRSEEHTSELQSPYDLVCRLLLEKKKKKKKHNTK